MTEISCVYKVHSKIRKFINVSSLRAPGTRLNLWLPNSRLFLNMRPIS